MATAQTSKASSTTKKKAASRSKSDALNILKADHREVRNLCAKFEKAGDETQQMAIAEQICLALKVHAQIEEELVYPLAREEAEADDLVNEAAVEHQVAKQLISEIERGKESDPLFEAKVTVLGEYVNHHVQEEEKEMFAAIRKADIDLQELGARIMKRKAELMRKAGAA